MLNILLVSSEDRCRSRMAEGLLESFGRGMNIVTAGLVDGKWVPEEVRTLMNENGRECSARKSRSVADVASGSWDYVITLCQEAEDELKYMHIQTAHWAHFYFDDPFQGLNLAETDVETVLASLFETMDKELYWFYRDELREQLLPRCTCGANTFCKCE